MPNVKLTEQANAALEKEPKMTEQELIARQAKQIEELRDEVADLKGRNRKAWMRIYCIGGPLNDNKLGYSKQQMVTFARIAEELGEV